MPRNLSTPPTALLVAGLAVPAVASRVVVPAGVPMGRIRFAVFTLAAFCVCGFARAASATLEGYCWPLSVAPGETLTFAISSTANYQVTFARYHRQDDTNVSTPLATMPNLPAGVQTPPDSAWKGCAWAPSFTFVIPSAWASGIYGAELSSTGSSTFRLSFVVRPSPAARGDFAVLANTNTWNAYNDWGGRSKYTSTPARLLGFLRPNPYIHANGSGTNHLTRAELWVLDWFESNGYRVDVYSDLDFHGGIPDLARYRGLILNTHPEYWTTEMLDRLESYLDQGGSVLYLGGNGIYERVEFSPDGRALTMFPGYFDGTRQARRYSYFRNLDPPRPERAVLGIAYRSDGFGTWAPFQVLQAGHRFFEGTGVANGQLIGPGGVNGGGASGWEMDTSIPGLAPDNAIVSASGSDDRGNPPANLELLARGTNAGGYGADMTYYVHPGGGGVFSAGSLSFGGSLVIDPVLQQIVRNVLEAFLASPLDVPARRKLALRALQTGHPNPFVRTTSVRLTLTHPGHIRLRVFDLAGRLVRALVDNVVSATIMDATWDGRDAAGRDVNAGIYLVRLEAFGVDETVRVLRLK